MSTEKIAETVEGQLDLSSNELVLTDKETTGGPGSGPDPVAYRGRSRNGGMVKFGGDYYGQELGYVFIKKDERYSSDPSRAAGEIELWVRKPDAGSTDQAAVKRVKVSHDGVILYDANNNPIVFSGSSGGSFPSQVALRTHWGKYLCVEPDGRVVANRDNPGPWETFTVVPV